MNNRIFVSLLRRGKQFAEHHARPKKLSTYSQLRQSRNLYTGDKQCSSKNGTSPATTTKDDVNVAVDRKYKIFYDQDAQIILDVNEAQRVINIDDFNTHAEPRDPYEGLNLKRGIHGVFDIQDLCVVLQKDNAKDIFVASVPTNLAYVDHIVITTAKSHKHMSALATFVRKVYKMKRTKGDVMPKVEGIHSKDWVALDLGNIALHIFSVKARAYYDLETLWTVGSKYDERSNEPNIEYDLIERYNAFLTDLQPAHT